MHRLLHYLQRKCYLAGVIERGESVDNLFAALTDIIDGYNLNFKTLEEIDMEDFEAVLNGDISVEEMCR